MLQRTLAAFGGTECEEKITGLSKCATVLRLLDHEELWYISYCLSVNGCDPPPPHAQIHTHTPIPKTH